MGWEATGIDTQHYVHDDKKGNDVIDKKQQYATSIKFTKNNDNNKFIIG